MQPQLQLLLFSLWLCRLGIKFSSRTCWRKDTLIWKLLLRWRRHNLVECLPRGRQSRDQDQENWSLVSKGTPRLLRRNQEEGSPPLVEVIITLALVPALLLLFQTLARKKALGRAESEVMFQHLLRNLNENQNKLQDQDARLALQRKRRGLNQSSLVLYQDQQAEVKLLWVKTHRLIRDKDQAKELLGNWTRDFLLPHMLRLEPQRFLKSQSPPLQW